MLPILIIASVYVPYVARPLRGHVLSLREREFMQAAIGSGASDLRILAKEILPNVAPSVIVFLPLMVAFNMLTESALSFLSIGVQPPNASWGTIINDGLGLLYTPARGRPGPGDHDRDHRDLAEHPRRRGPRRLRPQGPAAGSI